MATETFFDRMEQRVRALPSLSSKPENGIYFTSPIIVTEEGIGFILISSHPGNNLRAGLYAAINISLDTFRSNREVREAICGKLGNLVGDEEVLPSLKDQFLNLTGTPFVEPDDQSIRVNGEVYPLLAFKPIPL